MSLRDDCERDALAAGTQVGQLRAEVGRESDPDRRRVLMLRLEAAHSEHQRCLQALFFVDRNS